MANLIASMIVPMVNTSITTVGAGTLTAASLVGGVMSRTGPIAGFTDTTDTAAAIVALVPNPQVGMSWEFVYINGVAQTCTLANGAGVTISGTSGTTVAASVVRRYLMTITNVSAPAVTMYALGTMTA